MADIFFNTAWKELQIAQIAQVNQVCQLLNLIFDHDFQWRIQTFRQGGGGRSSRPSDKGGGPVPPKILLGPLGLILVEK